MSVAGTGSAKWALGGGVERRGRSNFREIENPTEYLEKGTTPCLSLQCRGSACPCSQQTQCQCWVPNARGGQRTHIDNKRKEEIMNLGSRQVPAEQGKCECLGGREEFNGMRKA